MTDRYNALIVVLDHDIREDDAEATMAAIRQLKGVLSVGGNVSDIPAMVAHERVRAELSRKLMDVLHPAVKGG